MGKTKRNKTISTIVLRTDGACEIRLNWLQEVYSGFKDLARELEQRLGPSLKKGQSILWFLTYHLVDDEPWTESIPLPWVSCEVYTVDPKGKRSQPFEAACFTWGPMWCRNSSKDLPDPAAVVEAAAQVLLA